MKTALHLFHLQVRKFSMQILFGEHDVTGKIIFIIKPFGFLSSITVIWEKCHFGLRIYSKFGV